jgi:hypothetical protein
MEMVAIIDLQLIPMQHDEIIALSRSMQVDEEFARAFNRIPLSAPSRLPPPPCVPGQTLKRTRISPDLNVERKQLKKTSCKTVSFADHFNVIEIPVVRVTDEVHYWSSGSEIRESVRADLKSFKRQQVCEEDVQNYVDRFDLVLQTVVRQTKVHEQNQTLAELLRSNYLDSPARGLEPYLFPTLRDMRRRTLRTILRAQSRLPAEMTAEEKTILLSEVSLRLTKSSRLMARWMGACDAKAVLKLVQES